MIAQFSIYPLDDVHISDDLAGVKSILDDSGLDYEVGPIGTCVQGEWNEVFETLKRCHIVHAEEPCTSLNNNLG